MRIKVTFKDILEVENEEEAYDSLIEYCNEVAKSGDVTSFSFEAVDGSVFFPRAKKTSNKNITAITEYTYVKNI